RLGSFRPFFLGNVDVRKPEKGGHIISLLREKVGIYFLSIVAAAGRNVQLREIARGRGELRADCERGAEGSLGGRIIALRDADDPEQGEVKRVLGVSFDQSTGHLGRLVEVFGTQLGQYQRRTGNGRAGVGGEHL